MVITGFLGLTEVVAGYVAMQVQGCPQILLTLFVVVFSFFVAGSFFYILWHKNFVFYPPWEYGQETDPMKYVEAMQRSPGLPQEIREQVEELEASPEDEAKWFGLIDSLLEEEIKQHLILMREQGVTIPLSKTLYYILSGCRNGKRFQKTGEVDGQEVCNRLSETELITVEPRGPAMKLTPRGERFADWLIQQGKKVENFESDGLGKWGVIRPIPGWWPIEEAPRREGDEPLKLATTQPDGDAGG